MPRRAARQAAETSQRIAVGVVGRPHGLDGSFHVVRVSAALPQVGDAVGVAGQELAVERRAGTTQRPIMRVAGCGDRDAAVALAGAELSIAVTEAPAIGEDEWWAYELIGCAVADGEREVGEVRGLLGLPSCEALEVARPDGSELLIPLVGDAVRTVDVRARRIDVDLRFVGQG